MLLYGHLQRLEISNYQTLMSFWAKKCPWKWSKLVWFKRRIPRHSFTAWMALKNGLKTLKKLKARGVVESDICVQCRNEPETEEHVLFDCTLAKELWLKLKRVMGYTRTAPTMEEELRWLLLLVQKDGVRLIFPAYIHWLWRARNMKIFEDKNLTADIVLHLVLNDVRVRMAANRYSMEDTQSRQYLEERWGINIEIKRKKLIGTKWNKPPIGVVKLNTDGSLSKDSKWGAVVWDHEGEALAAAHGISPYTLIDEIELDAVQQGLKVVKRHGFRELIINIDSATVVHYLRMEDPPWNVRHRVHRIKQDMEEMRMCLVEHYYREANSLADELASMEARERFEEIDINSMSVKCNEIISREKCDHMYERVV